MVGAYKGRKSRDGASIGDSNVQTERAAKPADEVESQRRRNESDIREWHLDRLLLFKETALEMTADGRLSDGEALLQEATTTESATQLDPSTHPERSSKANSSDKIEFALIILNQPIDLESEVFTNLFTHCIPQLHPY